MSYAMSTGFGIKQNLWFFNFLGLEVINNLSIKFKLLKITFLLLLINSLDIEFIYHLAIFIDELYFFIFSKVSL